MKISKGGLRLDDMLGWYAEEFEEWMDAGLELERRIADSARG
jgi:hypothetical protein